MSIYLCNRCKKVYTKRPSTIVVKCMMDHPPGDCCHFGEREVAIYSECPMCSADVKPKGGCYGFVYCTKCTFDTEKIFDEAFMIAVSRGFDPISGEIYK